MQRNISITLVLLIILPLLIACKQDDAVSQSNTTTELVHTMENTTEKLLPELPETDLGGEAFTFLVTGPEYGYGYYETIDIYVSEPSPDVLLDSVYRRNRYIEDKYNIKIEQVKSENVLNQAKKSISAGDDTYDAIFTTMNESAGLAQLGMLRDLRTVSYLDLSKPWWDQNAERELSIGGKTYFTTGEISTMDNGCTRLIFFNKKLVNEYNLDSPYEHIKNNTWTFDVYADMIKKVHADINGNGEQDDEDLYGTIAEHHNPGILVRGFGERFTTNNEQGYPEPSFMTERMINAVNKIWDVYFDESLCRYTVKTKKSQDYTNEFTYVRSLFTRDKFLFHLAGPLVLPEFRNMDSEFGLLPCPKLDSSQERYYHIVDPEAAMLSVPVTNIKDSAGIILEAMAAESMYTVTPAYNEIMLKRKFTRDEESQMVLDIVNQTRTYDMCTMYNWGGLPAMLEGLTKSKKRDITSAYEKISANVEKSIDATIKEFEKQ